MAHIITFPEDYVNDTDYIMLQLSFPVGFGSNTSENAGVWILDYGDIELSYEIDDPLLVPSIYSLKLVDPDDYLLPYFFPTSGDPAPLVTLYLNGDIEFQGKAIEDSIDYSYADKTYTFRAAPQTDIVNKTMLFDLDDNTLNPFGYSNSTYYLLRQYLEDIYQLVDPSISYSGGSLEITHGWEFYGKTDSPILYKFDFTLPDLKVLVNSFFFELQSYNRTTGDLLKHIAFSLASFTGMISNKRAFFRELFYYDAGNLQALATVLNHSKGYKFGLIDFVRIEELSGAGNPVIYDQGTQTNLENRYIDEGAGIYFYQNYGDPPLSFTNVLAAYSGRNYFIWAAKKDEIDGGAFTDHGDLLAKIWYDFRSEMSKLIIHRFTVSGVGYDFLKNFTYGGEKFQIVGMRKSFAKNTTVIDALNLGT